MTENQKEQKAGHAGAIIGFKTRKGEIVHARVASSFIGFEQADRNLKELGNDSFDTLVQKGQDAWNEVLGKIEVDGGNLCLLYTSGLLQIRNNRYELIFPEINKSSLISIDRENFYYIIEWAGYSYGL